MSADPLAKLLTQICRPLSVHDAADDGPPGVPTPSVLASTAVQPGIMPAIVAAVSPRYVVALLFGDVLGLPDVAACPLEP